jgi:hypothetical protein
LHLQLIAIITISLYLMKQAPTEMVINRPAPKGERAYTGNYL